jgi:hypothetical protein
MKYYCMFDSSLMEIKYLSLTIDQFWSKLYSDVRVGVLLDINSVIISEVVIGYGEDNNK